MTDLIEKKLRTLEEENGFRILYACESGSRAWGFASADSDYDIRVIYVWPRDRYLGVFSPPDTFDFGIDENDLDLSCWDLRKALPLFRKANGPLFEWLYSPIVYFEDEAVLAEWRGLIDAYFVPGHSVGHYLGLSRRINGVIREKGQVTAKKYLYVLRALLSAAFVVENRTPPPVEFTRLRRQVTLPTEVGPEIDSMIEEKAGGSESDLIPRNGILDAFVDQQLESVAEAASSLSSEKGSVLPLDEFFCSVLS